MKRVKVTYYRTIAGEFEIDVLDGEDEDEAVRSFLQEGASWEKFQVVTDNFADVESETGKRWISLSPLNPQVLFDH